MGKRRLKVISSSTSKNISPNKDTKVSSPDASSKLPNHNTSSIAHSKTSKILKQNNTNMSNNKPDLFEESDNSSDNSSINFEQEEEQSLYDSQESASDLQEQELHGQQHENEELEHNSSEHNDTSRYSKEMFINVTEEAPSNMSSDQMSSITRTNQSMKSVKEKIMELVQTLSDISSLKRDTNTTSPSRAELLEKLIKEIAFYYQYSTELASYFLKLFSPVEAIEFFDACETRCPMTLRTNTLKINRRELAQVLIRRGVNIDPVGEWTKVGLKVYDSSVPVGATPEYLAGHYMIQSASSFLPVIALAPQPGEKILDMAAAPGGKTSYIGQLMKNSGFLFANDISRSRCTALVANLQRLGVTNSIISNYDGTQLKSILPPMDRVLLDAPCSGLGIISRDPTIKVKRSILDLTTNAALQKSLLTEAIDICDANSKTGGFIVYSTCSISVEENEAVINHVLSLRNVKLQPIGTEFGVAAFSGFNGLKFHPSIPKFARRFYPQTHNLDGFFVAKFKKISNEIPYRKPKDRRKDLEAKIWGQESWTSKLLNTTIDFPKEKESQKASKFKPQDSHSKGTSKLISKKSNKKKKKKKINTQK